jgi:hypothetical protein
MALEIKINKEFYKERLEFNDFGVDPIDLVLTDTECFTIEKLTNDIQRLTNQKEKIKDEDVEYIQNSTEEVIKLIWKENKDLYFEKLGEKIFNMYNSSIIVDVNCVVMKNEETRSANIIKKHKLKSAKIK